MALKLFPLDIDGVTIVYIETTEEDVIGVIDQEDIPVTRGGSNSLSDPNKSQSINNLIRSYTKYTLEALKNVAITDVNINKVSLEFGIEVAGEAGIPYITKGTAKSNIKVTLECNFSQNKESI